MRNLLLIDPDRLLRWSLERHLCRWFRVVSAENRPDAKAALEAEPFDAVVLSVDVDPLIKDLEKSAKNRNHDVRIVRLTTGRRAAHAEAGVACIEKPFRLETLARVLGIEEVHVGDTHVR